MDYAKDISNAEYSNHRKKAEQTIIQSVRRILKNDAQHRGRTTDKKGQTTMCTDTAVTNGFLRTVFLPRWKEDKTIQATKRDKKMERDFFKSLSKVAKHYAVKTLNVDNYPYPNNMKLALWDLNNKLKSTVNNLDSLRFVKEDTKHFFVTEETYNTASTLYYIPMVPLFHLLKKSKSRKSAVLLLSVCCYLYHLADIPYYTQQDSYLYWQYEMLTDWVEQDENEEETAVYLREFTVGKWIGDYMEQKISNKKNLELFEKRLKKFTCTDSLDAECKILAEKTLELLVKYPNESIFRNAKRFALDIDQDAGIDEEMVTMEKYISFYADCEGWLHDTLLEVTNNELNEYGEIEEPYLLKKFDGRKLTTKTLDFENRLFDVMERLSTLLTNYKTK